MAIIKDLFAPTAPPAENWKLPESIKTSRIIPDLFAPKPGNAAEAATLGVAESMARGMTLGSTKGFQPGGENIPRERFARLQKNWDKLTPEARMRELKNIQEVSDFIKKEGKQFEEEKKRRELTMQEHPIAATGGKIVGGVLPVTAATSMGIPAPVAFGGLNAVEEVTRQVENPQEDLNLLQRGGKVATAYATGHVVGKVIKSADVKPVISKVVGEAPKIVTAATKTILGRAARTGVGTAATAFTGSLTQDAISGLDPNIPKAAQEAVLAGGTMALFRAVHELPEMRGSLYAEANRHVGKPKLDPKAKLGEVYEKPKNIEEAKKIVEEVTGQKPEELSPQFQAARQQVMSKKMVQEVDAYGKEQGWDAAKIKTYKSLIQEKNLAAAKDAAIKELYGISKKTVIGEPKFTENGELILPTGEVKFAKVYPEQYSRMLRQVIEGGDPAQIIAMAQITRQLPVIEQQIVETAQKPAVPVISEQAKPPIPGETAVAPEAPKPGEIVQPGAIPGPGAILPPHLQGIVKKEAEITDVTPPGYGPEAPKEKEPTTYISMSEGGGYSLIHNGQPISKSGLSMEEINKVAKSFKPLTDPHTGKPLDTIKATHIWNGEEGKFYPIESIQAAAPLRAKHFTTAEGKAALESGAKFDFTKRPIHGTGSLAQTNAERTDRFAGDRIYLSLNDPVWGTTSHREGEDKTVEVTLENMKDLQAAGAEMVYDYDKQKWMAKVGAKVVTDKLASVDYEIDPGAKIKVIDSLNALYAAQDEIKETALHNEKNFFDALAKKYDAVIFKNVDKIINDTDSKFFKAIRADQIIVLNQDKARIIKPTVEKKTKKETKKRVYVKVNLSDDDKIILDKVEKDIVHAAPGNRYVTRDDSGEVVKVGYEPSDYAYLPYWVEGWDKKSVMTVIKNARSGKVTEKQNAMLQHLLSLYKEMENEQSESAKEGIERTEVRQNQGVAEEDFAKLVETVRAEAEALSTDELAAFIDQKYEEMASPMVIDILETLYDARISEDNQDITEEELQMSEETHEGAGLEEQLINMYHRYLNPELRNKMEVKEIIDNMRDAIETYGGGGPGLIKVGGIDFSDEQILDAAKDVYERKMELLRKQRADNKEFPVEEMLKSPKLTEPELYQKYLDDAKKLKYSKLGAKNYADGKMKEYLAHKSKTEKKPADQQIGFQGGAAGFGTQTKGQEELFKKPPEAVKEGQANYEKEKSDLSNKSRKITLRSAPLQAKYTATGSLYFPKEEIVGPHDVAFAFKQLRNAAVEHLYCIGVKDNKPVAVELISIGTLDASLVHPFEFIRLLLDKKCDSFYMAHNHPSGNIEPSEEDLNVSRRMDIALGGIKIEFKGHVVIDDTKFGFIDPENNISTFTHISESATKTEVPVYTKYNKWLESPEAQRQQILGPDTVFEIVKGMTYDLTGTDLVFYLNTQNQIISLEAIPHGKKQLKTIVEHASAVRTKNIVMATATKEFKDFETVENGLAAIGIQLFDIIYVDLPGNTFKSGISNTGEDRQISNVVVAESAAGYGNQPPAEAQVTEKDEVNKGEFKLYAEVQALVNKYAKLFGERYQGKQRLGVFYPQTKNIFLKTVNNLGTAAHEVMHFLDDKFNIATTVMGKTGESITGNPVYSHETLKERQLLTKIYVQYYPDASAKHKLLKRVQEGMAVLVQYYILRPDVITSEYPELVNMFFKEGGKYYDPTVNAMMKDGQDIMRRYNKLDPLQKIGATVMSDSRPVERESWLNIKEKILQEVFDDVYSLEKIGFEAGKRGTAADPSLWARLYRNINSLIINNITSDVRGYWTVSNGIPKKLHDFNWKTIIKSLTDSATFEQFGNWLVARDTKFNYDLLDVLREEAKQAAEFLKEIKDDYAAGMIGGNIRADVADAKQKIQAYKDLASMLAKNKIPRETANAAYDQHKNRFSGVAGMFDKLVRADLDLLHDTGMIKDKQYDKLISKQGYATLKRDIYNELLGEPTKERPLTKTKVGRNKVSSMMARRGSDLTIINPLYSAILNHAEIMKKAVRQIVYNKIYDLSGQFPDIFQKIDLVRGMDKDGKFIYPQDKDPNILMAWVDGNRKPLLVSKEVKTVLDEILTYQNIHLFEKILIGANKLFTKGTTGLYLPFTFSNFVVDQTTALAQTHEKLKPVFDPLKTMFVALNSQFKGFNSEDERYLEEYLVLGGSRQTLAGWQDLSPEDLRKVLALERHYLNQAVDLFNKAEDLVAFLPKWSEILTRASEYIRARKAGKDVIVAMEEAGRVTAPFHHRGRLGGGTVGRSLIQGWPFMNASLQVLAQFGRTMKDPLTRKRALLVILAIMAASIASLAYLITKGTKKQKDTYRSIPATELSAYVYFPAPNGEDLIRIRVPDQMNAITTLMNMAIANQWMNAEYTGPEFADAATAWMPDQLNITDPARVITSWIPQLAAPAIGVVMNKKFYPHVRPIESMSMENKPAKERYTEYTGTVYKWLGQKLNLSPVKLEFLVQGYFGRATRFATQNWSTLPNPFVREMYLSGGRQLQKYYDLKEQNAFDYSANKHGTKKFTDEEKNRILQIHNKVNSIDDLLEKYRKTQNLNRKDPELLNLRDQILGKVDAL